MAGLPRRSPSPRLTEATAPRRLWQLALVAYASRGDLSKQRLDLVLERPNLGVDLLEGPRRHVAIEMPRERDLVADLRLRAVDPSVGDVRQNLGGHIQVDRPAVHLAREPL